MFHMHTDLIDGLQAEAERDSRSPIPALAPLGNDVWVRTCWHCKNVFPTAHEADLCEYRHEGLDEHGQNRWGDHATEADS